MDDISDLADRKSLEDDMKGSTIPPPPELTLDMKTAAVSFTLEDLPPHTLEQEDRSPP